MWPRGAGPPRVLIMVENVALARDHRLRKQVQALVGAGYGVSVICRRDPANEAGPGVRLHEYPATPDATSKLGYLREYGWSLLMAGWLMLRVWFREGFDVLQISGTPDIFFIVSAPFRLLGRQVVLDQRDLSPELYEHRFGRRDRVYRLLLTLERASYRNADHVLTVNESLRRVAIQRGGLAAEQVTVVGNGPVLARCGPRPKQPALRHGRRFLCCWVGVMGPQDQVELALRVVRHLVLEIGRTDCHFAVVGDGESRAAAIDLARGFGIEELVSFPGWLAEDEAFGYLSSADLGIEPNLEPTVSPVKGMEYMAFGVPFVAFDLPETRILAGDAAAYAPPADVAELARLIDALLDDPVRRAEMGRAGRQRVLQEVAWDHQERRYLAAYRSLLGAATDPATQRQHPEQVNR
ncbi:MAG: hypothetical protein QOK10_911 [Pseudonocardiales bacterium]|jgi:glycosyltransferase involved in cell wall biosynthesis|nr:hypothetical protein [Pseudonocardiales bacterium]